MEDKRREILSQVATHSITPEEAAARLDELERGAPAPPAPQATSVESAPEASGPVRRVKVVSTIGTADVVGDPTVAFCVAEGVHRARQDGDTMVIEHAPFEESDNFTFGKGGRRVVINGLDVQQRRVLVRMNPDLPLSANVTAGSLRVRGVHSTIDAEVSAGACRIDDFRAPMHLHIQAGSVTASGRLDSGDSHIQCEMGSVKMHLIKGSSVRVTARSTMGKVMVEGDDDDVVVLGRGGKDVTIGGGKATLDIESTMGSVRLSSE